MKRYAIHIIIIIMVLISSFCTRQPSGRITALELAAIDSLLWTQPDSAFVQLQTFAESRAMDSLDTYNKHYFHLLLSELLYKNDYAQTNRNELLRSVDYYDSLVAKGGFRVDDDLVFLDARAHYIDGVGYYEMDSVVPACREYLRAVEPMEKRFSENDLTENRAQFMALVYTHLCGLFSDQYLHEQAIGLGKQSLFYYKRYKATPWYVSWMLDEIGMQYDMMKQWDSAYVYYHQAQNALPDTVGLSFRDNKTHLLQLSYNNGLLTHQKVVHELHSLLAAAESDKEFFARCLTIGDIFYNEHLFDSAWPYLNKVFYGTACIEFKKQAAEWLVQTCKELGRNSESVIYAAYLVPFANQEENKSAIKTQLTTLHHEHEQDRLEFLHDRETNQIHQTVNWVVWTLLLGVLLVAVLFSKKIKNERRSHSIIQAALGGRLKQSNKLLREKTRQLERVNNTLLSESDKFGKQVSYADFIQSPICSYLIDVAEKYNFKPKTDYLIYKSIALDKKQLEALMEAADRQLGKFPVRIRLRYPALTNDDVKYCCLYLLGLNEADISALMQRAYSTVCERSRKIKRILGTDSDLPIALRDLL